MSKKYITYSRSGVGEAYNSKPEKIGIIIDAIGSLTTSKNKYVIGGIGGFAGCFDLGKFMRERVSLIKSKIK